MGDNIPEISDLELVCCHEAGHGTLEYLLGYSIISIEVNPSEGYGSCSYDHQPHVRLGILESQDIPEIGKHIMIYCAGSAAVSILTNTKQCWHRSSDYAYAVDELAPVYKDKKVITNYIQSMWCWARYLLKKPQNWYAVKTLADALVWYPEKEDHENWYGSEMEELLPEDFYEEPELRDMDGKEVEETIRDALTEYGQTPVTKIHFR
jgi:hypothetical protein